MGIYEYTLSSKLSYVQSVFFSIRSASLLALIQTRALTIID